MSSSPRRTPPTPSGVEAELSVVAESIDRYRERISALALTARTAAGDDHDDLVASIHEAERSLRTAHRHIQRAIKLSR